MLERSNCWEISVLSLVAIRTFRRSSVPYWSRLHLVPDGPWYHKDETHISNQTSLQSGQLTNVDAFLNPFNIINSRGVKQIVIHEGYKPELLDRSYNDIALIKFDRPFFAEKVLIPGQGELMPICLPPSSTFKDEDKHGGNLYGLTYHDMTIKKLKYPSKNWKPAHRDVSSIWLSVQ